MRKTMTFIPAGKVRKGMTYSPSLWSGARVALEDAKEDRNWTGSVTIKSAYCYNGQIIHTWLMSKEAVLLVGQ